MAIEKLTDARVKQLAKTPPASGRTETWDARTRGLCLRVTSGGAATWSLRYMPREGAAYQRITLGNLNDLGLAEARERAAQYRSEIIGGEDPQRERMMRRVAAADGLTFDQLAEKYLTDYARPRKSSWRNDELYLNRPRQRWGERDPKTITRRDCIVLLDEIKQTAPVSANRTHSVLVTLFNWAVEDQLLDASPIAGLKKRAPEKPKERALSDSEIVLLWRALASEGSVGDALKAILLTGQRPGEVAGAIRDELVELDDPKKARWELPASRVKGRRPHVVPLPPMARALFAMDRGNDTGVFASRFMSRKTLARHSLSQALKRISNELPELRENPPTPHDLRRTVATNLARLGIAREDRLAVLGHRQSDVHGAVYDRYDRLAERRRALAAWEQYLTELLDPGELGSKVVSITRPRQ